ncbi:MAG TPA: GDSL-type esterase/lipase family protein [Chitinispirillaceae bacterium]|nr:GDSL-type esterase/lipase family protein [Chitinispirillaceae bacterium]
MNCKTFFLLLVLFSGLITAEIKVACIGNSITSGYSNTGYSYVPRLSALLGSGYQVKNFGVSGTTLFKNGDNPYWKTSSFTQALTSNADIITIKLGTNDTKTFNWNYHFNEFKSDYNSLIDTLLKSTTKKPLIYPVFPVPIFKNSVANSWGMRDSIIINFEMPVIREIAAERGLTVIDAYTPLLPFSKYFSVDGVHPDSSAADSIAHIIYRVIRAKTSISNLKPVSSKYHTTNVQLRISLIPDVIDRPDKNLSGEPVVKTFYMLDGRCIGRNNTDCYENGDQPLSVNGKSGHSRVLIMQSDNH